MRTISWMFTDNGCRHSGQLRIKLEINCQVHQHDPSSKLEHWKLNTSGLRRSARDERDTVQIWYICDFYRPRAMTDDTEANIVSIATTDFDCASRRVPGIRKPKQLPKRAIDCMQRSQYFNIICILSYL